GGQQRTLLTGELRGGGEQALDGDLVIAPLQLRVEHVRRRVPTHRARGEEVDQIVRTELGRFRHRLAVRPLDGERRRVAVALQVDAVALQAQRVVNLQGGLFPL